MLRTRRFFSEKAALFYIISLSSALSVLHIYRIQKNPNFYWAPAIDQKLFGSVALNYLDGHGFRFDALEAYQLSQNTTSLDSRTFAFLHPFIIALMMKGLGDYSFFPILYSTVLYGALIPPLFFFVLKKVFSVGWALLGTVLFTISPEILNLGPSGQSEPLMFVELFSALISLFYIRKKTIASLCAGICMGLMNITRPSGMILTPAMLVLAGRLNGWKCACIFLIGFGMPTLYGKWMTAQAPLAYDRLFYPLVGSQHIGGPDEHVYFPETNKLKIVILNWRTIAKKAVIHAFWMARDLFAFFSDYWFFGPYGLLILWQRRKVWVSVFALVVFFSVTSVVFYWYVPRVTLHLFPLFFLSGLYFLRLNERVFSNTRIFWAVALALPIAWLFTERFSGQLKILFQILVALSLVLTLIQRCVSQRWQQILSVIGIAAFLAIQIRSVNSNVKTHVRLRQPAGLFPFQRSMALLPHRGIPQDSIMISEEMRNLTWFGRMRGLITPSNIEDTVRFLDRFQQGIYVVHLSKLQANYEKRYASVGLQPIPLGLEGIFVYGKPAKGKSIKPPL